MGQHGMSPSERADLLDRGLVQLPKDKQHARPLLIAGWGTPDQVQDAAAEFGWDFGVSFHAFATNVSDRGDRWNPERLHEFVAPKGAISTEINGEMIGVWRYELWEFVVRENSAACCIQLLKSLPWKRWKQRKGVSLVGAIAAEGSPDLMQWLLKNGGDPNGVWEASTGSRALHGVAHYRQGDEARRLISMLLEAGADLEGRSRSGVTPLAYAVGMNRDFNVTRALLQAGADVHADQRNARSVLAVAVSFGAPLEVVELLLEAGADPNEEDANGRSVLYWAELMASKEVTERIERAVREAD